MSEEPASTSPSIKGKRVTANRPTPALAAKAETPKKRGIPSPLSVPTAELAAASLVAAETAPPEEHEKARKSKTHKLVRDSFKFPPKEYAIFEQLKSRCLSAGVVAKKSELVRAGLIALQALSDRELLATLEQLEKLKTGRPAR
jgi:hypothetical protein